MFYGSLRLVKYMYIIHRMCITVQTKLDLASYSAAHRAPRYACPWLRGRGHCNWAARRKRAPDSARSHSAHTRTRRSGHAATTTKYMRSSMRCARLRTSFEPASNRMSPSMHSVHHDCFTAPVAGRKKARQLRSVAAHEPRRMGQERGAHARVRLLGAASRCRFDQCRRLQQEGDQQEALRPEERQGPRGGPQHGE